MTDKQIRPMTGFTLLEMLITLVITSVGLLGLVSLQLTSMRNAHEASIHSQATTYVNDMVERILANPVSARNGIYNIAHGVLGNNQDCSSVSCNSAALAAYDLYTWQSELMDALPSGGGQITTANGADNTQTVTIAVRWDDDLDGDQGTACAGDATGPGDGDLDCIRVAINLGRNNP